MKTTERNYGLDLLRAGAIVAVLFSHSAEWWLDATPLTTLRATFIGRAGVELFFSLSGFLIGGILIGAMDGGGLEPGTILRFWLRRWLRTLPAYWVMIVALNVLFGTHDWQSVFFLQTVVPAREPTPNMPQTWSLVIEEWFYLIMPLLLAGMRAVVGRSRAGWVVPTVCAALLLGCAFGRAAVGLTSSLIWGPDPTVNPILRLDAAVWGVLAAWLVWRRPLPRGVAVASLLLGVALLTVLGQVWVMYFAPERLVPWGVLVWHAAYEPAHYSAEALAAALLVLGLHQLLPAGGGWFAEFARATARLSYSLYLVHVPVSALCLMYGLPVAADWWARLFTAILVVLAALALRHAVELPALAFRNRSTASPQIT